MGAEKLQIRYQISYQISQETPQVRKMPMMYLSQPRKLASNLELRTAKL